MDFRAAEMPESARPACPPLGPGGEEEDAGPVVNGVLL